MILSKIETDDGFQIIIETKESSVDTEYPETAWRVMEHSEEGPECVDAGVEESIDKCLEKAIFCIIDWKKQCDAEEKAKRTDK